jgi:hypothetical protein
MPLKQAEAAHSVLCCEDGITLMFQQQFPYGKPRPIVIDAGDSGRCRRPASQLHRHQCPHSQTIWAGILEPGCRGVFYELGAGLRERLATVLPLLQESTPHFGARVENRLPPVRFIGSPSRPRIVTKGAETLD